MQDLKNLKKKVIKITEPGEFKAVYKGLGDSVYQDKLTFLVAKPNLDFDITIKAVLRDRSRFDLEAILKVPKGSKNTDTYLKLDCLLLSDKARARLIPSLEITEDAVKSGHGATVSEVDKEYLNYLKSRGVCHSQAEELIVEGFLKG